MVYHYRHSRILALQCLLVEIFTSTQKWYHAHSMHIIYVASAIIPRLEKFLQNNLPTTIVLLRLVLDAMNKDEVESAAGALAAAVGQ